MRTEAEKKEFSDRLKQALGRSRKKIQTPTELANAFNLRYHGESIAVQSAYKWLMGIAVPTPDKIEILADMLKVPVQWLRFGIADVPNDGLKPITSRDNSKLVQATPEELQLISRLRAMPPHRRKLLQDLISDLALEHEAWKH